MTSDPIVDEVRGFRDALAKQHDYDIDAIFETFRALEAASGARQVSLPPRRIEGAVVPERQPPATV